MSKIFGDWRKPEDSLRETLKAYPDPLQAGQDWASRVLAGRGIDARKNSSDAIRELRRENSDLSLRQAAYLVKNML